MMVFGGSAPVRELAQNVSALSEELHDLKRTLAEKGVLVEGDNPETLEVETSWWRRTLARVGL